jgi:hypothetical protein
MIVLALMASLPEVVCCCDVSWGPGGLLGGKSLCQERCSAAKTCCSEHATREGQPKCDAAGSDCGCTFAIVTPAPISVAPSVELDQAQLVDAILLGWTSAAVEILTGARPAVDDAAPPLTPVRRCAFLQTWLI